MFSCIFDFVMLMLRLVLKLLRLYRCIYTYFDILSPATLSSAHLLASQVEFYENGDSIRLRGPVISSSSSSSSLGYLAFAGESAKWESHKGSSMPH